MGLGLFALAVFMFYESAHDYPGPKTIIGGVLLSIFGFFAIWAAISYSYTGDCPTCGAPQDGIGGLHRCDMCLAYGEVKDKQYCQIEMDRIFNRPAFTIVLPDEWTLPKLCCVCGVPYSRVFRLRIVRKEFAFDLPAPHCDAHSNGAELTAEYSRLEKRHVPVLKVASYTFYREFLKQNGMGRM